MLIDLSLAVLLYCCLHVIDVLKDNLVASIFMISQPESHIFIAGFVQRGEDIVPWHSCAQNYCFEGLDVIYFFFSKLLHDIFIFAVVLGASLLTVSKLKYKKVDIT